MKRTFIGLTVFALTFAAALFAVWTLAKPAPSLSYAQNEHAPNSVVMPGTPAIEPTREPESDNGNTEETRTEFFTDDKRIGRRGKNKIEIRCYSRGNERFAEIKFYTRTEYDAWLEWQSFKFDKDGVTDCNPIVEDFNNDGLNDFTYESAVAARGANEVRKLFIYDERQDELIYIKNSEEYPNLAYNKKLRCIDSFMVHGATSTVFLRIEGDTLKEFASVSTGEEQVVTITDKFGNERVLSRKKMDPDNFEQIYTRFTTFSPPR
ncbi:MAG: hypothetical protein AB7F88_15130 [Pyrinomonadaceae bacterium]